jgi:hypothetical protein
MGPRQFSGLLARDPGHRDGPSNFVARCSRSCATGQHQHYNKRKQKRCNTPNHGRPFDVAPRLLYARLSAGMLGKDEVSEGQNVGKTKKKDSRLNAHPQP